jgi:hypothetical protein
MVVAIGAGDVFSKGRDFTNRQGLRERVMRKRINEAAGENPRIIQAAIVAIDGRDLTQTEAMYARRILPWERVATLLFGPRRR